MIFVKKIAMSRKYMNTARLRSITVIEEGKNSCSEKLFKILLKSIYRGKLSSIEFGLVILKKEQYK